MYAKERRQPSPALGRVRSGEGQGMNSRDFLSGAGVGQLLGGIVYQNGRQANGSSLPYNQHATSPGFPLTLASTPLKQISTIPASPARSEPHTPSSTAAAAAASKGLSKTNSTSLSSPVGKPTGSVPGFAQPTFSSNMVLNRRNSLSSTAPAGSLAGMVKLVETSSSSATVRSGVATTLGSTLPLPSSSSRPGTATLQLGGGSRPPTATTSTIRAANPVSGLPLALSSGSSQSMGCRGYQEDFRHILDPATTPGLQGLTNVHMAAAVYDGHGGKRVSQWLTSQYMFLNKIVEAAQAHLAAGNNPDSLEAPLDEVFSACGSHAVAQRFTAGSCVAVALVCHQNGIPWVVGANVGDSRTIVVSWDDDASRPDAAQLSIDHKLGPAKTSEETRRVQAAGGSVMQLFGTWRIDGSLAVARAIGDYDFCRYVSYRPTVVCRRVQARDRWVIIGSDGLWDVMSNEEVAMYCKAQSHLSAAKLSDALVKEATKNRGSGDNTTVVAIRIQYTPK